MPKKALAKIGAMIGAVFMLFITMILLSELWPALDNANQEIAKQDTTGLATATLEAQNSIPDPKGSFKQHAGGFLKGLLENHPMAFMLLVVIIALILFYAGIKVSSVRNF